MRRITFLVLCLSSGCFDPDIAALNYRCDNKVSVCPSGYVCSQTYCERDPAYAQKPPLITDAAGCASGLGYRLSAKLYACVGTFNNAIAGQTRDDLCKSRFVSCTQQLLVDAPGLAACGLLGGFFISADSINWNGSATCTAGTAGCRKAYFGCGLPSDGTVVVDVAQSGVAQQTGVTRQAITCDADPAFTCPPDTANRNQPLLTASDFGALCCR